ncbi:hypothetical protein M3152_05480 [Sporosarcina luteola]|uniref:hypothetical protein n=1 Tax=Bacillales TaxID=1385 RepID=UPI0020420EA6|nr:hypothetical protein [Saccharococcus sp. Marseille-Q5394]MCM3637168.1 hypothetical protein [Sporosarcina luteola]
MKTKFTISFTLLICLFFAGCSDDYQESFTFTDTVEEILVEEEMLIMKEYGGVSHGRREGNVYEIPVDNVEKYNIGQKLEITVFSNTDADIWRLDNMKFDIKTIEN